MVDEVLRGLKRDIAKGKIILVAGAGVTIQTTDAAPNSAWADLLRTGVKKTTSFCSMPQTWEHRQLEAISSGDVTDWLAVAQQVETRLRLIGEFDGFLTETIGHLKAKKPNLIKAIDLIEAPIATTNYDTLIGKLLGRSAVEWTSAFDLGGWIRRQLPEDQILHLHGIWNRPETVIFGDASYARLLANDSAQFVQKALAATSNLLFIGCGRTTEDPNVGALMEWVSKERGKTRSRHYRLCTRSEKNASATEARTIQPIVYGETHGDLEAFIRTELAQWKHQIPDQVKEWAGQMDNVKGPRAWESINKIFFDKLIPYLLANPIKLDALEDSPSYGLSVTTVLAQLIACPIAEDISRIRDIFHRVPAIDHDTKYKILDVFISYGKAGVALSDDQRALMQGILDSFERDHPADVDFNAWIAKAKALLTL